jgi:DNA-binding beta-propeller fold protein YncE
MQYAYSVTVSGNYAYVAGGGSDNLVIVDISDPSNPTTVGNWDPNDTNVMDSAQSVTVSGNYAYVAGYLSDNLAIVDIGALEVSNVSAGQIKTDNLEVQQHAQFDQGINVMGGANIGSDLYVQGTGAFTNFGTSTLTQPALWQVL